MQSISMGSEQVVRLVCVSGRVIVRIAITTRDYRPISEPEASKRQPWSAYLNRMLAVSLISKWLDHRDPVESEVVGRYGIGGSVAGCFCEQAKHFLCATGVDRFGGRVHAARE